MKRKLDIVVYTCDSSYTEDRDGGSWLKARFGESLRAPT
jgi:hypothetical protein